MQQKSPTISSNQTGIHLNLRKIVARQLASTDMKPISKHTQQAFHQALDWLGNWQGDLILDSCCGVGESTVNIARVHPNARVIGIDKSAHRTEKHRFYADTLPNYLILRADLNDFLRLLVLAGKKLTKHYLLYPNPYPKAAHLQRRWYATSALKNILQLGGELEVRSNWLLYIEEFSAALNVTNVSNQIGKFESEHPITPFERKYWQSGQRSWQLLARLNTDSCSFQHETF